MMYSRSSSPSKASLRLRTGNLANSPRVAEQIKNAESAGASIATDRRTLAAKKADAYEKLERGMIDPANPPPQIEIIRRGLVPPGMSQQQAAILYNSLPNNLKMPYTPQPGSSEWVARMAGEPVDPMPKLPDGTTPAQIRAANQVQLEQYMRNKFGPGAIVPSQVDHAWLAQHAKRTANGFIVAKDNQVSLIPAQYAYDPSPVTPNMGGYGSIREMTDQTGSIVRQYGYDPWGNVTVLQGSGPESDFGFAGMYQHGRSGLNLTMYRAYSPVLGRWLSRDPLGELISPNLYGYGGRYNNPISFVDPLGLDGGSMIYGSHPMQQLGGNAADLIGSTQAFFRVPFRIYTRGLDFSGLRFVQCPIKPGDPGNTNMPPPDTSPDQGPYIWPGSTPWNPRQTAPYNQRL